MIALIYTSFKRVGYKLLVSPGTDPDLQQIFIERIVHRRWDAYNPPGPEYRAIYLFQADPGTTLFGWLYNDGADDLARRDVPYFVCYCLSGTLKAERLAEVFTCLQRGPAFLPGRDHEPAALGPAPDLGDYEPERSGVAVPEALQQWCARAVARGECLNLFLGDSNTVQAPQPGPPPAVVLPKALPTGRSWLRALPVAVAGLFVALGAVGWQWLAGNPGHEKLPTAAITASAPAALTRSSGALRSKQPKARTLTGHLDTVWSVAVSPNGNLIGSASADSTVRLWQQGEGRLLRILRGHRGIVRTTAFSPDGRLIASGASDGTVKLWDPERGRLIASFGGATGTIWSVAFSPDGALVAGGGSDQTIRIWDIKRRRLVRYFRNPGGEVWALVFSPGGALVASGSSDGAIRLWDSARGTLRGTLKGHRLTVRTLAIDRATGLLASGSWDRTVKLWDWRTAKLLRTLAGHSDRVVTVALSADGRTLGSSGRDRTIKVWNTANGHLVRTFAAHSDWVVALAFGPHGELVSASKDRTIKVWNRVVDK